MTSTTKKGNYYKARTREYYKDRGFDVVMTEFVYTLKLGDKTIWKKFDLLGSDLIAYNENDFILVNSKATTEDVLQGVNKMKSSGKIKFLEYKIPSFIKKHVVVWEPRKEPKIFELVGDEMNEVFIEKPVATLPF